MKRIQDAVETSFGAYPERVLQFGEGNFLRAFVDWMIDDLNQKGLFGGSIVLCQPIPGGQEIRDILNEQDGNYTVVMRGMEDGHPRQRERLITSVSRCINAYDDYDELVRLFCSPDLEVIVSNTTEAGIVYREGQRLTDAPPESFPAKLTQLLYRRYEAFDGHGHGLLFLPVELIDDNGYELKRIILRHAAEWGLPAEFRRWVEAENRFTSTLVDRIVTGFPKDELEQLWQRFGYQDKAVVTCECFNLWVIEGDQDWASIVPLGMGEGKVIWTSDVRPYKMRKVRILNGGHTSTVLAACLSGHELVLDLMNDAAYISFLQKLLYEEVIPMLPLSQAELTPFAEDVLQRFRNPYIKHRLLDISMNSVSKFTARCLPSLLAFAETKGTLPPCLTFSLAALLRFYRGTQTETGMTGRRFDGSTYPIRDGQEVSQRLARAWEQGPEGAAAALGDAMLWGQDLTKIPGLQEAVTGYLQRLEHERPEEIIWELTGSSR